jgi:signal transduction histidine kinase
MQLTLQERLLFSYLLLVTLAVVLVTGHLGLSFRNFYLDQARADLLERALYIADTLQREERALRQSRVHEMVARYRRHSALTLRVFDAGGRLVASSLVTEALGAPMHDLPGAREALAGHPISGIIDGGQPSSDRLYVMVPVQTAGLTLGRPLGAVRLSLKLRDMNAALARLWQIGIIGLLVAVAVCGTVSALLARSISAPLRQLGQMAAQIRSGRLGVTVSLRHKDDIGRLGEAMNGMSRRLAEQEQERSTFLATASHELRTPITNIQASLDALVAAGKASPEQRERLLGGALAEARRMGRLVEELMDLAYLEAGTTRFTMRPVTLDALIDQTMEAAAPRMKEKELRGRREGAPGAAVQADAGRLQQALANLIDNAIRYSPPRGTITITATVDQGRVRVDVSDEGPGIPVEALPHLFERFFTADPSRSRSRGGAGLGLYLVRRIVDAHGGEVAAANAPRGGARVSLLLPVASRCAASTTTTNRPPGNPAVETAG